MTSSDSELDSQGPSPESTQVVQTTSVLAQLRAQVTKDRFSAWYAEQQFAENILEGQAYFNGPADPKPPARHSPSTLLECHRKASYKRQNAPKEDTPPEGLFWIGTEFEERLAVPFLQDVTPPDTYVTNSVWIDHELTVDGVTVQLRGATDPAIVTPDDDPLLVTEIKTTSSLDHLSGPKEAHKAQLHAYLAALNADYDHEISTGLLVYASRTTLDVEVFEVAFDEAFWEAVTEWMAALTTYEQAGELPPASPERDWECSYCSFKHRCGEADTPYSDIGHDGLLPLFDNYDTENLKAYLNAHAERDARLTPTLAHKFPRLADEYGVYDWACPSCGETFDWKNIDWETDSTDPPYCPSCLKAGEMVTIAGPEPEDQLTAPGE
ncbi:PD-(D/E)XK nuclease family protein [Halobacterium litoreum]|uniref:PD-(D/E)XK nuclease family protein n=1 Tax=Halobacterium litoreum TaxID=2039234 RepID=A0ABD5NEP0_9EURY|nr:PD-(D/E)XK nuclease family protein [Halobacterium litoreum]UHH13397.1 PD-(D/E)XK nuclease family protein [Halobacterium litoreum]